MDEDNCSSSDQFDIDQCGNGQCGNLIGGKRKRHAMSRQIRQSNIEGTDWYELSKEISVPVISPENCKTVAGTVCLEIKNKPINKEIDGPGNNSVPSIHTTKTICVCPPETSNDRNGGSMFGCSIRGALRCPTI